jgi:dUTP pyrophosphatase
VALVNLDPAATVHVRRGDRIAQLVVQRIEEVRWLEVDRLPGSHRGGGGFGSTGWSTVEGRNPAGPAGPGEEVR